jgi:hypothetical protein
MQISRYWIYAAVDQIIKCIIIIIILLISLDIYRVYDGPPLWSSGQSSWLQIRRLRFDSRHYQKKVVGLERGPLSLVGTTEELLDRKVEDPV